ncbi:hypothetical protein [Streptomyces sp. F001]|uniref:hypothetical protein n=1 Tax=Streptomyces sp. F001 TaxID=1510026 RepID=UPI0019D2B5BF|nr:hypothetical protein [Streptomyces sp. F001]
MTPRCPILPEASSPSNPAPPTAALDARAEHRIYTRLKALAAGRPTVFITHRLANTRLADRIAFLDQGRISEVGTYEVLIDQAGASLRC